MKFVMLVKEKAPFGAFFYLFFGKNRGSYMVRPVLQVKLIRNIKKYCFHISGLGVRYFVSRDI